MCKLCIESYIMCKIRVQSYVIQHLLINRIEQPFWVGVVIQVNTSISSCIDAFWAATLSWSWNSIWTLLVNQVAKMLLCTHLVMILEFNLDITCKSSFIDAFWAATLLWSWNSIWTLLVNQVVLMLLCSHLLVILKFNLYFTCKSSCKDASMQPPCHDLGIQFGHYL